MMMIIVSSSLSLLKEDLLAFGHLTSIVRFFNWVPLWNYPRRVSGQSSQGGMIKKLKFDAGYIDISIQGSLREPKSQTSMTKVAKIAKLVQWSYANTTKMAWNWLKTITTVKMGENIWQHSYSNNRMLSMCKENINFLNCWHFSDIK